MVLQWLACPGDAKTVLGCEGQPVRLTAGRITASPSLRCMAGALNIAEVMFPGGSPELVEPIYKNPNLSAPFNEQLANVICAYVRHRLPSLATGEKVLLRLTHAHLRMHHHCLQQQTLINPIEHQG